MALQEKLIKSLHIRDRIGRAGKALGERVHRTDTPKKTSVSDAEEEFFNSSFYESIGAAHCYSNFLEGVAEGFFKAETADGTEEYFSKIQDIIRAESEKRIGDNGDVCRATRAICAGAAGALVSSSVDMRQKHPDVAYRLARDAMQTLQIGSETTIVQLSSTIDTHWLRETYRLIRLLGEKDGFNLTNKQDVAEVHKQVGERLLRYTNDPPLI